MAVGIQDCLLDLTLTGAMYRQKGYNHLIFFKVSIQSESLDWDMGEC